MQCLNTLFDAIFASVRSKKITTYNRCPRSIDVWNTPRSEARKIERIGYTTKGCFRQNCQAVDRDHWTFFSWSLFGRELYTRIQIIFSLCFGSHCSYFREQSYWKLKNHGNNVPLTIGAKNVWIAKFLKHLTWTAKLVCYY